MSSTTALEKCKRPLLLQALHLTPGETGPSPVALLPVVGDDLPTSAQPSAPTKPTHSRTRRRASNEEARSFRDLQRKMSMRTFQLEIQLFIVEDRWAFIRPTLHPSPINSHPGEARTPSVRQQQRHDPRARRHSSWHRPPPRARARLPALHIDPAHLGIISAR
jgi:hypothetical protein